MQVSQTVIFKGSCPIVSTVSIRVYIPKFHVFLASCLMPFTRDRGTKIDMKIDSRRYAKTTMKNRFFGKSLGSGKYRTSMVPRSIVLIKKR